MGFFAWLRSRGIFMKFFHLLSPNKTCPPPLCHHSISSCILYTFPSDFITDHSHTAYKLRSVVVEVNLTKAHSTLTQRVLGNDRIKPYSRKNGLSPVPACGVTLHAKAAFVSRKSHISGTSIFFFRIRCGIPIACSAATSSHELYPFVAVCLIPEIFASSSSISFTSSVP
ncbi:unnamed protein product [Haemonchus placei]|uniref:Uncharacterized protein n=1 Tax=Haemonchus placei TaxID=6290 RepID=A0A3P7UIX7_HAEPC|nr:unnamed protein product [Haemonchus placei]